MEQQRNKKRNTKTKTDINTPHSRQPPQAITL